MTRNEQYWIDRANRRMDGYQLSAIRQAKIINRSYNQTCNYVQSEIAKILRHIGDDDSLAYEYRMKRLNALLGKTKQKMQELYGVTLNDTTEFLRSIIPEAYYHTIFDIAQGIGEQPVFSAVNSRLINQIVNDQWSGKNYSQRIWWNTSKLSEDVQQLLTTAAMTGESIYKTSRRLSERFGESMNNSVRLIRTETTYSCNQAELASYEELDIDRYKYVATLDTRTSTICQKLDGKIFKTKDAKAGTNLPAMHPNCRSTTIAYFDDFEPPFRIAKDKDGKNIQVPANMTYDEWHEKYIKPYESEKGTKKPPNPSKGKDTTSSKPTPQRTPESVPATVDVPASNNGQQKYKNEPIPPKINNQSIDNSSGSSIIKEKGRNREIKPLPSDKVVPVLRNTARDWINGLSNEEVRAVKKYTKNSGDPKDDKFYKRLNAMLRGDISTNDTLNYYSNVISEAISKFELQHDIICYRAVSKNPIKGKKVGDIYEPKQFLSSSVTAAGAMNGEYSIAILTPKGSRGAYIEQLSKYPKQREFLFDKDVKYKILAINEKRIILEAIV